MATIKSFTDLSQSKVLAKILPLESADMYYFLDPTPAGNIYHLVVQQIAFGVRTREPEYDKGDVPCWSLASLLGVLPDELEDNHFLTLSKEGAEYCCCYEDINGNSFRHTFADNPVDACYSLIIKLNELKML